ncbi:helix-turn-helix domain-containing protein [Planctopirus limnophila]|uniref:helix-turn-helix domain-containing protein n=1 Tax=Planctopirus limnophila TaxID=120 RepID=UPI0011D11F09|nr:helix-turn-helix domain-containing protein [Planctopirus limnophila]
MAIIPPEPATNLEPIITGSAPAGGEATPASKLNAWPEEIKEKLLNTATPLEQRIIRFFWERKHASDIQSLIDAAWGDKPDTSVETVKKAIQRLNLKFADNLTISFHPSTDRVQFELLKHSGNSQQPDKSADKF